MSTTSSRVCVIITDGEMCGRKHKAYGMCGTHYKRHLRGDQIDAPIIQRKQWGRGGKCAVDGCDESIRRFGVCNTHSSRVFAHGDADPDMPINKRVKRDPFCLVDGCPRGSRRWGYCTLHSQRVKINGDPGEPESRKVYEHFVRLCEHCDAEFDVHYCHREARFCSMECYRTSGNRVSSIERLVATELNIRGIEYEPQCYLAPYYPDFIVGMTIIEVDGDYWHTLPGVPERDAQKDTFYKSLGFDVIRIWEHEIKADDFSKLDALTA